MSSDDLFFDQPDLNLENDVMTQINLLKEIFNLYVDEFLVYNKKLAEMLINSPFEQPTFLKDQINKSIEKIINLLIEINSCAGQNSGRNSFIISTQNFLKLNLKIDKSENGVDYKCYVKYYPGLDQLINSKYCVLQKDVDEVTCSIIEKLVEFQESRDKQTVPNGDLSSHEDRKSKILRTKSGRTKSNVVPNSVYSFLSDSSADEPIMVLSRRMRATRMTRRIIMTPKIFREACDSKINFF